MLQMMDVLQHLYRSISSSFYRRHFFFSCVMLDMIPAEITVTHLLWTVGANCCRACDCSIALIAMDGFKRTYLYLHQFD